MSLPTISSGLRAIRFDSILSVADDTINHYDIVIEFHSAEDLPKMDVIGHADPYFIANIDDHISFTSTILANTGNPVWKNEKWIVRNIPLTAKLKVRLYDKDDDKIVDDYIGEFEIFDLINYSPPPKGHPIIGSGNRQRGYFHLSIHSMRSSEETETLPPYTFDGPCRYSRHDSLAVGRLTMLNTECIYSTWKIQIRRISFYFHPDDRQHWNEEYKVAKTIFGNCPLALASQSAIKLAHKMLYGRTLKNSDSGILTNSDELWKIVFTDPKKGRIKPCVYTYIIDDYTWRFSETDGHFFSDFASKHALLANVCESVRYAGEFHPRPKYGWDKCDEEWELVFDNSSGTYSPNPDLLGNLRELLSENFPGLNVVTYGHSDPKLKESLEQLKQASERYQNSTETIGALVMNFSETSSLKS